MFVKVCCIDSIDEARLALSAGASAIGLVSAMPSGPGPIAEELIAEIAARMLINERIKEELRSGKTLKASIDAGYTRAFLTIMDSNLTTIIAAVFLFQFGTGPVKGFALTLTIGLIANIFTAVAVTRLIFDYFVVERRIKTLSI